MAELPTSGRVLDTGQDRLLSRVGAEALRRAFAEGRALHGDLDLDEPGFAAAVCGLWARRRQRLGLPLQATEFPRDVERLVVADLYLASACERGSARAWERLRTMVEPIVQRMLRRYAKAGEAEAVSSATLADLCLPPPRGPTRTLLGTYDGSGPLWAWLSTIAVRRLQAAARRRTAEPPPGEPATPPGTEPLDGLEAVALAERFAAGLPGAWARLEVVERAALVFKHRDGLSQRATALLLGVSEPTVSRLVRGGLAKLRGGLADVLGLCAGESPSDAVWTRLEAVLAHHLEIAGVPDTPLREVP